MMYKRIKRTHNGSVINKAACKSSSISENLVTEIDVTTNLTSESNEGEKFVTKENSMTVMNKPIDSWNIQEIFSSFGMDINEEPSIVLSMSNFNSVKKL